MIDDIQLGPSLAGKEQLVGTGDPDSLAPDLHGGLGCRHRSKVSTPIALP
jgi:hypothetical protein